MATFNGQLSANKIMSSIFNMIISQFVSSKVVEGLFSELHDEAVDESGLAGDSKLYYFVQPLKSSKWDETDTNVLARHLPADPYCQKITIDEYRQCAITLDSYLSKQAWSSEGAFSQFHGVMLGQLESTKKIEETGIVNVFVGTTESAVIPTFELSEDDVPSIGQGLAELVANIEVELKDLNRLNDLKYARSYSPADMRIVINSKYANQIKNIDLPAIYHSEFFDSVMSKAKILPARYFGTINTVAKETADASTRACEECDVTVGQVVTHCYPGDSIPVGASLVTSGAITIPTYQEDSDIVAKVMSVDSVKMLSAFTVSTSFFNSKNLSENTYLTWGRSAPAYLLDRPFLTIKKVA